MIQFLLITMVILLYTFQSLFSRMYTDNYPADKSYAPSVFAIVCGAVVALTSLCFSGFSFGPFQWVTLILGAINAIIVYCYDEFIIQASSTGDYSTLMVFSIGGGIIIPAICSPLFFDGEVLITQIIAIVIICIAVYMVSYKKPEVGEENGKKNTKLHIILCSLLAIANGTYGVMLEAQNYFNSISNAPDETQKNLFIIYTFVGAAIISAIRLIIKKRGESLSVFRQSKKSLIFLILSAIVSAVAINIMVIAIDYINTTLLYTFDNSGVMLLSVLASAFIFREKLSKLNIVGCAIMTVALVLMGGASTIESFVAGLLA